MISFRNRDIDIQELMDDPDCDRTKLMRTYRQFGWLNRVVASWTSIFTKDLLRAVENHKGSNAPITLLDVGCGLMDNARYLQQLASAHGYRLEVTGIDPNPVAAEMLAKQGLPEGFTFKQCYLNEIRSSGETYDIVISNHLLHHLSESQLHDFFDDLRHVTGGIALMNDLRRSGISWAGFGLATLPLRWYSFLSIDGMRSIRRSFQLHEMQRLIDRVPVDQGRWSVKPVFPFRMLVEYSRLTTHEEQP